MKVLKMSLCPVVRFFVVILIYRVTDAKKDLKSACSTCQQITENFSKGFDRTANQNFGGGNTAWEERKLSKYETSEIRLMEIVEGLCETSSFECNHMVEEHEELFEMWWFKMKTQHPDLHKWFCIETIKVCCPKGTFGPDCNDCVGDSERPCHGNGQCDGDGTRGGDGKCSCNHGYKGELCLDCIDGYFNEVRNDTFSLCTECHVSCKTCNGATNQDCDECKEGWEEDDQEACVDVDECAKDPSPCEHDQYCLNTNGSFYCKACDVACSGCTGGRPDQCQACASGYQDTEGTCTDVDECSQQESPCPKDHQECINTQSSYVCICASGFKEEDGECIPTPHSEQEEAPEASESDPHGEL
ncbi:cysteine-rich with EGF-like domain protein 2 isoform X2 [Thalassophryne amazonica]|uniref:cysteine-rich with EGF-like domain protein 2 isoform X2 n=1 Tax=Thalassophryne amazonica TaxID=390379 RepID=UPI0014708B3D|nr:cysteine-rich with EGF-like domain protein 2 isoform X2 [Thalassophryne amazonica]